MLNREQLQQHMMDRLHTLMPAMEIAAKFELVQEINELKREKNAVILGHNYMEPALFHFVADITGDSLELCRQAAKATQATIVFCGVKFMAETAKVLNPNRTVLLPSQKAGCSLAASITAQDVRDLRQKYPGVPIVTYVNTYADVKAESDICCTSGNAARIVRALPHNTVILLPDEYLAKNVALETGKKIIVAGRGGHEQVHDGYRELKNTMVAWSGKCEVHDQFTPEDIKNARRQFPDVVILAHPECAPEITALADFTGSTSAMVRYVREHPAKQYMILTECSMGDNIIAENPDRDILRLCSIRCPHMNQITLEQTRAALLKNQYPIELPADLITKARKAVDRMLEF